MTEEKAKTKWCPMKRFNLVDPASGTTTTTETFEAVNKRWKAAQEERARSVNCIGSGCMMWRWDDWETPQFKGHCGLAGIE